MLITESTLRRIIREALITEARYTPQTLLDKGLRVRVKFKGNMVYVRCGKAAGDEPSRGTLWVDRGTPNRKGHGRCHDAWEVAVSLVNDSGMGPLLYDVAMELSGKHGLMPDREDVSADARRLWDIYRSKRGDVEVRGGVEVQGDVEVRQLDNPEDELTPGVEEDNCWQESALEDKDSVSWSDSPLSKVYRSQGTPTIDALQAMNLIDIQEV